MEALPPTPSARDRRTRGPVSSPSIEWFSDPERGISYCCRSFQLPASSSQRAPDTGQRAAGSGYRLAGSGAVERAERPAAPGKPRLVGADASHAWVAVYCGADGWIDFDPTNDLVATDHHVTLAWGRDYADVAPIKGVILGGGEHTVEVAVVVEPL